MATLGQTNKNPLNIRKSDDKRWRCETGSYKGFRVFSSLLYGYRAAFMVLHTYFYKYNVRTLSGIINRWAPPTENDTRNYLEFVRTKMNVRANLELDFCNKETMVNLVDAMAMMESSSFGDREIIASAYDLFANEKNLKIDEGEPC